MRITCDVISDLLPLYIDESCTKDSREVVEEHLKICEICEEKLKRMEKELPILTEPIEEAEFYRKDERRARAIFKRLQKRWKINRAGLILACVFVIFGSLELSGGIALSNIKGIILAHKTMEAIIHEDYKKAFSYVDTNTRLYHLKNLEYKEQETIDTALWSPADRAFFTYKDYTESEYREEMQVNFILRMKNMNEKGIYVKKAAFHSVTKTIPSSWKVSYLAEIYDAGEERNYDIKINFFYKDKTFTLSGVEKIEDTINNEIFNEIEKALF